MLAAGPATGSALAFLELRAGPFDVVAARLRPLHRLDPADPFVAREWSNVFPLAERGFVRNEDLSKVRRKLVNDAGADGQSSHAMATPIRLKV
jgi:hypothetical protein